MFEVVSSILMDFMNFLPEYVLIFIICTAIGRFIR